MRSPLFLAAFLGVAIAWAPDSARAQASGAERVRELEARVADLERALEAERADAQARERDHVGRLDEAVEERDEVLRELDAVRKELQRQRDAVRRAEERAGRVAPLIEAAIGSKDPALRAAAREAALDLELPGAAAALVGALGSETPAERLAAASTLLRHDLLADAAPKLLAWTRDESAPPSQRRAAFDAALEALPPFLLPMLDGAAARLGGDAEARLLQRKPVGEAAAAGLPIAQEALRELPPWLARTDRLLREQRATCLFDKTPVPEVAGFFADLTGLTVIVLPGLAARADARVNLRIASAPVGAVIRLACEAVQGAALVRWGAVLLGTPEEIWALAAEAPETGVAGEAEADRALLERARTRTVSASFEETPLAAALGFFADVTGVPIECAEGAGADAVQVTISLKDVALADALSLILRPRGLRWAVRGGALRVEKAAAK